MIPQSASPCVYPEDIECVLDPVDSRGGIFISNVEAASNLLTLRRHNIKAILTAAFNINLTHQKSDIPLYLHVPGQDHEKFDLSCYFEEAVAFIRKALETTNVNTRLLRFWSTAWLGSQDQSPWSSPILSSSKE